ncbi:MAG: hypothetical protein LBD32_01175 [Cytophagales bacterium]|jgi:hypothetical protein|nr:hypothetical protein [Cytophagales bacterium]
MGKFENSFLKLFVFITAVSSCSNCENKDDDKDDEEPNKKVRKVELEDLKNPPPPPAQKSLTQLQNGDVSQPPAKPAAPEETQTPSPKPTITTKVGTSLPQSLTNAPHIEDTEKFYDVLARTKCCIKHLGYSGEHLSMRLKVAGEDYCIDLSILYDILFFFTDNGYFGKDDAINNAFLWGMTISLVKKIFSNAHWDIVNELDPDERISLTPGKMQQSDYFIFDFKGKNLEKEVYPPYRALFKILCGEKIFVLDGDRFIWTNMDSSNVHLSPRIYNSCKWGALGGAYDANTASWTGFNPHEAAKRIMALANS